MSEKFQDIREVQRPKQSAERERPVEKLSQHEREQAEKHQSKAAEFARSKAEQHAVSGKETGPGKQAEATLPPSSPSIKATTYRQTMRRIEAKLPVPQRIFSKVIHAPVIDAVSNVAGKTVARPSGILGAGLVATAGMAVTLYYARTLGFELSGSEFVVLILAGWLAGILIELAVRQLRRHRA